MYYYHDPFKSLACNSLGEYGGNVESVSGQSCIGEYGKSLFQIFDLSSATIITFASLSSSIQISSMQQSWVLWNSRKCEQPELQRGQWQVIISNVRYDLSSATILTFVLLSSCPFKSPACYNLGFYGNNYESQVGSICQSCIGNYCEFIQIF